MYNVCIICLILIRIIRKQLMIVSNMDLQARSQTFEKGGANFQEFMNSIYPEGDIVT